MIHVDITAESINDFARYLALTGAVPALLAFLTYVLGRPRQWWKSWLGWTLALLLFSIVLVFAVVLGRRLGGDYTGYQWTAVVAYSLMTVALWLAFIIIIRERRRGRVLGFVDTTPTPVSKGKAMTDSNINAVPTGNGTLTALDPTDPSKTVTVDAATGEPTAKPTGKVLAAGVGGAIVTGVGVVAVAVLGGIGPDILAPLGPWALPVGLGIGALTAYLSGYLKRP